MSCETETVRAHVWVSGRVQGVFFRAYTEEEAQRLGLCGWVRNLRDGRVEAVFEGPKDRVDQMINWCHHGPPSARVTNVQITWEKTKQEKGFRVVY
jgi:acylphosphatase